MYSLEGLVPRWMGKDTSSNVSSMPVKDSQIPLNISDIEPVSRVSDRFDMVRRELEGCLEINSIDAKIKEEISRVFVSIDQIREFRDFPNRKSIHLILNKVDQSQKIIGSILESHRKDLSSDDFSRLGSCLEEIGSSLDWSRDVLVGFEALSGKLLWLMSVLESESVKKSDWSKVISALTVVTKGIDVFNQYLDNDRCDLVLQALEMTSKFIILYSVGSKRLSGFGFADISSYTQPATAELLARQMLVVVETKRKVWLEGQSAEVKALDRIENEHLIEWEVAPQSAEPIKIEEISSRLKERGYGKLI